MKDLVEAARALVEAVDLYEHDHNDSDYDAMLAARDLLRAKLQLPRRGGQITVVAVPGMYDPSADEWTP